MNSRLAQIIAASIGPDGTPNRSKIFEELSITPDAPETLLLDAFLAADNGVRTLALVVSKSQQALADTIRTELTGLDKAFQAHSRMLDSATKALTEFHRLELTAHASRVSSIDEHGAALQASATELKNLTSSIQASQDRCLAEFKVSQKTCSVAVRHLTGKIVLVVVAASFVAGIAVGASCLGLFIHFNR